MAAESEASLHRKIPSSVAELRREFGVSEDIGLALYSKGEAVPDGGTVVYAGQFLAGLSLPLSDFAADFLSAVRLCPGQLAGNGWRIIRCCEILVDVFQVPVDTRYLCAKFNMKETLAKSTSYCFSLRPGAEQPFPGLPHADKQWKAVPILVTGPWQSGRRIPNRPQKVEKGLGAFRSDRIYRLVEAKVEAIDAKIKDAMGEKPHWHLLHRFLPVDPAAGAPFKKPKAEPTPSTGGNGAGSQPSAGNPVEEITGVAAVAAASANDSRPAPPLGTTAPTTPNPPSHHLSMEELTRWYREDKRRRKKELADVRAAFAREVEALRKEAADLTATSRTEKERLEKEAAELRDALRAAGIRLDATLSKERGLQVSLDQARSATETLLAQQRSKQASELEDLRSVTGGRLTKLRSKHTSELDELRKRHEGRLAEERERIKAELVEELRGAMASSSSGEDGAAGGKDGLAIG